MAALLHEAGYSLQANAKALERGQHPDRNAQFQYGGREWQPQGWPERVHVHDFQDPQLGKAIPYGIYDVVRNAGWVTVGQDHDTASFAVASLQRWWQADGVAAYPQADRLLICVDGGGSNGYRVRLWKVELQRFATDTRLQVTVCHLPPGTSKWNKIEHRLFAYISMNWRGRPLVSHEVVVELIGATTTRAGLRVQAELDPTRYPTQVKVPDAEMARLRLTPHPFPRRVELRHRARSPVTRSVNVIRARALRVAGGGVGRRRFGLIVRQSHRFHSVRCTLLQSRRAGSKD